MASRPEVPPSGSFCLGQGDQNYDWRGSSLGGTFPETWRDDGEKNARDYPRLGCRRFSSGDKSTAA